MDENLKADWVAALRSGEFGQLSGQLGNEREGSYCCLGVLCEVAKAKGLPVESYSRYEGDLFYKVNNGEEIDAELNRAEREYFGLEEDIHTRLIKMNDDEGANFVEIADYIEKNVPTEHPTLDFSV